MTEDPEYVFIKIVFLGNSRLRVGREHAWLISPKRTNVMAIRDLVLQAFPPLRLCQDRTTVLLERRYTSFGRIVLEPAAQVSIIVLPP
ncbi:hypothetical protein RB195_025808 [Necator americanus]|uniref:Uncharacterized protein n=1 Tax=Necator americanus TaxID=51031 RepID=A0ABR1EU19_NECAM